MRNDQHFKYASLSIVWLWVLLFALAPFCLVISTSFLSHTDEKLFTLPFTLENYTALSDPSYSYVFEKSLSMAGLTTALCLALGYPFAFVIARMQHRWKNILMLLVIIPFWTSSLIRSYALIAIIKAKGVLNTFLIWAGIIHQPLSILFTNTAVIIGLVYNLLPFMILPIMTNVERLDQRLIEAAYDLGASRWTTFRKVIIPLTLPGIISGSTLVFLPAMTMFYIPDILGGAKSVLLGNVIQNRFMITDNWPLGAALSTLLTFILATLILLHLWVGRRSKQKDWL